MALMTDHHGDRRGRGAAEPLPRAHCRREPRTDPRHPRRASASADAGGPAAGARTSAAIRALHQQRPAPAAAAAGGQPLRRARSPFCRRPDPHPARPLKYLTLIRADRPAAPAPAADAACWSGADAVAYIEATPADIARPTGWPMRCWAAPWTSCRPRPGGCWWC